MNTCMLCGALTANPKFCSRSHAASYGNTAKPKRRKQPPQEIKCVGCDSVHYNKKALYCSQACYFSNRTAVWAQRWTAGEVTGTTPCGPSYKAKQHLITSRGECCEICGWAEIHPVTGRVPIQLDHIDGDRTNNRPENLRLLCPNHHALTPTYGALNKRKV